MIKNSAIKIFMLWPSYWLFPVADYPDEENLSDGEVELMTFDGADAKDLGYQVVGSMDGYDFIYKHIGSGYYKCTSKTEELAI